MTTKIKYFDSLGLLYKLDNDEMKYYNISNSRWISSFHTFDALVLKEILNSNFINIIESNPSMALIY